MYPCQESLNRKIRQSPGDLGKFLALMEECDLCTCEDHLSALFDDTPPEKKEYKFNDGTCFTQTDMKRIKDAVQQFSAIKEVLRTSMTSMVSYEEKMRIEQNSINLFGYLPGDAYNEQSKKLIQLMEDMYTKYVEN